jgi:hypothetical protein
MIKRYEHTYHLILASQTPWKEKPEGVTRDASSYRKRYNSHSTFLDGM